MNDIAIRVENLSKRYRIGQRERYLTLRDVLTRSFTAPFRLFRRDDQSPVPNSQSKSNYIWALKDVSFEVKRGEVVGIIGRNGAGKTTLLKILSRITEPTEGYAEVRGRVGSLLEVGTGFHPELTGRENIYLSGAILGMKKREIDRKFDEIVAFAEVEKFIDTPVKHYSSGMYVRLAFAVAAHLEPEILLVDEVLAVGDAAFQKKCLGKMGDVAKEGRTVLFVSHSMAAIRQLTHWTIWLEAGIIKGLGQSTQIVECYLNTMNSDEVLVSKNASEWAEMSIHLSPTVSALEPIKIDVHVKAFQTILAGSIYLKITASDGTLISRLSSKDDGIVFDLSAGQQIILQWECPANYLAPGNYRIDVYLDDRLEKPLVSCTQRLHVDGTLLPPRYSRGFANTGYIVFKGNWRVTLVDSITPSKHTHSS